jgi:hypothetical protein
MCIHRVIILVMAAVGLVGCTAPVQKAASAPAISATVSSISFTGPGLDGVPTFEPYADLNNNNIHDPGEPWVDTLITAPEYVPAIGRNKEGFMLTASRFQVKVVVAIAGVDRVRASVSAVCREHPELNLPEQTLVPGAKGIYSAILQIKQPIGRITIYEHYSWRWTITVNGAKYSDVSINTIVVSVGTGADG